MELSSTTTTAVNIYPALGIQHIPFNSHVMRQVPLLLALFIDVVKKLETVFFNQKTLCSSLHPCFLPFILSRLYSSMITAIHPADMKKRWFLLSFWIYLMD